MAESYTQRDEDGAAPEVVLATELLSRLVPGANAALLVTALLAERGASVRPVPDDAASGAAEDALAPPQRELARVRGQLALGEAARTMQHALNNPLTALLAEAQLLQLEPMAEEQRLAVARMVELARRVVSVTRRLDGRPTTSG